jgi:hypothetical protein
MAHLSPGTSGCPLTGMFGALAARQPSTIAALSCNKSRHPCCFWLSPTQVLGYSAATGFMLHVIGLSLDECATMRGSAQLQLRKEPLQHVSAENFP